MPTGTARYFVYPFAINGDVTAIPDPTQAGGAISYQQGFGPDYSLPSSNPAYLTIPRNQFNQLMYDVTSTLQQIYQNGFPLFITAAMNGGVAFSYSKNSYVYQPVDGNVYYSLVNTNTDVPPTANWQAISTTSYFNAATDTGSANHYVIAPVPAPTSYQAGQIYILQPANANTGACDINIGGLGIKSIKTQANQDPSAGMIIPTGTYFISYNSGTGCAVVLNPTTTTATAFNSCSGFLVSGITGNHTSANFTLTAGQASNSTNAAYISGGPYSWAASNGNTINGTDAASSTLGNSTTYHVFVCSGASGTGSFVSASLTPTFPTGYNTYSRRVASFNTGSSGSPIPYTSIEVEGGATVNWLTTQILDMSAVAVGSSSRTLYTMTVPTGIKMGWLYRSLTQSLNTILITSGDETDVAPVSEVSASVPLFDCSYLTNNNSGPTSPPRDGLVTTNTFGQVGFRAISSTSTTSTVTRGFKDFRRN